MLKRGFTLIETLVVIAIIGIIATIISVSLLGARDKARKISKEDAEILVVCCPPWSEEDEILV